MAQHSEPDSPVTSSPLSPAMTSTSAKAFLNQSDFEHHILKTIHNASEPQILVFTDIKPSWGQQVVDLINETDDGCSTRKTYDSLMKVLRIKVMPTEVHDCCQDWWRLSEIRLRENGDLTGDEQAQVKIRVGTTLQFVGGPYRSSRKEPDLFVRSSRDRLPSFVMESGWSESWSELLDDMNLLLVGGDGDIRAVAILKWDLNRQTSVVRGFVELYVRDRQGMPVRRQREEIFPAPRAPTAPQRLELTRQEVFGPFLSPDPGRTQPPNDTVYLELDTLRTVASEALARMNLLPAF
ncbi:hypothetical protein N7445_007098 [Penicillium cf. griseofulvum]|nr:hypothetical protein N7445_007098 [Penicillium cf. griseofulvum]